MTLFLSIACCLYLIIISGKFDWKLSNDLLQFWYNQLRNSSFGIWTLFLLDPTLIISLWLNGILTFSWRICLRYTRIRQLIINNLMWYFETERIYRRKNWKSSSLDSLSAHRPNIVLLGLQFDYDSSTILLMSIVKSDEDYWSWKSIGLKCLFVCNTAQSITMYVIIPISRCITERTWVLIAVTSSSALISYAFSECYRFQKICFADEINCEIDAVSYV